MPSPFPGMDPYLEHPARWADVHQSLIATIRTVLNASLPSGYVARTGERCFIVLSERNILPDVFVQSVPAASGRSASAVLAPDLPLIVEETGDELRQPFIEVYRAADSRHVITTIELLSPTNKLRGIGRDAYVDKQRELLDSNTHLLEIDLLREGAPTIAALRPAINSAFYSVCLHRAGAGRRYEVWHIPLASRLSRVAVPLENDLPDVMLDLQAVFERNYDESRYALDTDYRHDCVPPLTGADAEWAEALLREKGLR